MKLWIRLSLRNAFRNRRRTLLTAATVMLGSALLIVALTWINGIFGGMARSYTAASGHIRVVTKAFAQREELSPLYENIADVEPMLKALRSVPGVVSAEPRITTGVAITAGEEIGDHFAMVIGATESYYRDRLEGSTKLAKGEWLSGKKKEVVLGRKVASEIGVNVGDEVLLLGQTQDGSMSPVAAKVVGVVASDAMVERTAFLPLKEIQWLADMEGGALEILVYSNSHEAKILDPIVRQVAQLPECKEMNVTGWHQREPWVSTNGMMSGMRAFIELLIVFIAALAIFNTMTMAVLERSGEIGVMRAMGLTRLGAVGLFVVEALVIGVLGGLAGAGLGSIGGFWLQEKGVTLGEDVIDKMGGDFPMTATFYGDLTPEIILTGIMFGLIIAVAGAILPSLRAASIQPVVAMRARR